ncbi:MULTISPECIES: gamma-glutamyltransferase family protein [Roseobacteraceae]|uniref:Putative gamma-glutamyltransferase YwrD n=1 Tax=Pseudosulfitobacter pseudonitzschiae TaxID=1402135 RepID=A0A221K7X7_9RHOB|nr:MULTISPECIES: gamma-glutamyltransferase family protein [Roseobacteraceae]ASM75075.1 putative gamma-glutamyltransferase YwrD [Pseudosulfitobacter pseudonitzschiae]
MFDFFSARRPDTLASRAMIATSHPLATAAGLDILTDGGNAVDVAIAAVAVQCVVDPLMTGIGGDCFALYAPKGGAVKALNGSGRAPAAATVEALKAAGLTDHIPQTSPHAVTIPGAISAWCRLHEDHGSLPLDRIFARAIGYAEDGFPVTPRVAQDWADNAAIVGKDPAAGVHFLPGGKSPAPGSRFAQPLLGTRLREIAAHGAKAFYEGETAAKMAAHLQSLGGLHTEQDFHDARDQAHWVTPISTAYAGHDVVECPPNGQGLAALLILRILSKIDLAADMSEADRIHIHAEATKIAYHHRDELIADPESCHGLTETLLSDEIVDTLAARIDMTHAGTPALWDEPEHRDTIYLCVVDAEGNALSFINSIFHGFGSTRFDPTTGVLFHSRGASFRLIDGHPNAIAPYKRPMHTIIPGMLCKDGQAVMPFGVMGGDYQAAGHAAFLSNVFDRGMSLQEAMDAPRSFAFGGELQIEPGVSEAAREELAKRGHKLRLMTSPIGGSQAILIDTQTGMLSGGSDARKDGMALGF